MIKIFTFRTAVFTFSSSKQLHSLFGCKGLDKTDAPQSLFIGNLETFLNSHFFHTITIYKYSPIEQANIPLHRK